MGLLFVWLSPEGEVLCLPEGSTSGCEGFPIDPKTLPELAFGRVCVTYDCLPIFLALGQAGVSASLRFFDLSRFFRAFYGVKQELPIEEAFTQFGVRGKPLPSLFLSKMMEFEALSLEDVFGEGYRDCYLEYPRLLNAFASVDRHRKLRQEAISRFDPSLIKRLVFFDIECANCFGGVCKICEFGHVDCGLDLSISGEGEMLMNPEDGFHLGGIRLAYAERTYFSEPPFPAFYQRIKDLLEDRSTLPVGFAAGNDVKFLCSSCLRYKLEEMRFLCLDLQPIADELLGSDRSVSLEDACIEFGAISPTEVHLHQAKGDAYLTFALFRAIAEEFGGVEGLIDSKKDTLLFSGGVSDCLTFPVPKLRYW